ncbi:MAG: hypothetical protein Q4B23_01800 [Helcococcus sp.]|nr:hypothetical protein [Helcococcus sp.]
MPNQKVTSSIPEKFKETIIIKIIYEGPDNSIYSEIFTINTNISSDLLWLKHESKNDETLVTSIKLGAQSIAKTLK